MNPVALILLLGPIIPASPPDAASPTDPAALLARYECHRCHEGTGLPALPESQRCVGCHRSILGGRFDAPPEVLAAWRPNLRSLRAAPSLAGLGRVLRRDWLEAFLLSPEDLRPHLPATMPRLAIAEADAAALARHLVPDEEVAGVPDPARVEEGRALYRRLRCADCHRFGGSGEAPRSDSPFRVHAAGAPAADPMALAPDLRFARRRMQPGALVPWLLDPSSRRPDTLMPKPSISEREAQALASFVWHAALEPEAPSSVPPRLQPLARRVSYAEVEARVFRKVCWHCHSSPDYNRGDGGPGNTGGFGFPPRRLDLSSYESVAAGLIGPGGARQSVFAPAADGVPRLLAVLWARRAEERGEPVPGLRGMPLGLPALSDEELQLVESWISQGRPR